MKDSVVAPSVVGGGRRRASVEKGIQRNSASRRRGRRWEGEGDMGWWCCGGRRSARARAGEGLFFPLACNLQASRAAHVLPRSSSVTCPPGYGGSVVWHSARVLAVGGPLTDNVST